MSDGISLYEKVSIMIVDDSPENLTVLSNALKKWGYSVRPAINGKQAITAAQKNPPDLVLLDIMMPDMDGFEVCRMLKENTATKDIPIIFISAMDKMFDEIKGFDSGAVDYITKPLQLPLLKSRIDTHIQLKFRRDHLERMVSERIKEINSLLSAIKTILIGISTDKTITHWNNEAELTFRIKSGDIIGRIFDQSFVNWDWDRINDGFSTVILKGNPVNIKELRFISEGIQGEFPRFLNIKISLIRDIENNTSGFLLTGEDITEVRTMRIQSNHAQKLEAIGRLAAGIAHEINTPSQYIRDNVVFVQESIQELLPIINKFTGLHEHENGYEIANLIFDLLKSADYNFLAEEIPKALMQALEGIDRIAKLASSMKKFSHPGSSTKSLSDINKIIEDAVTISKNEWKYFSTIELDLDKNMKDLECYGDDLGRVFLNMIINAAHAIEEKLGKKADEKGIIKISTKYLGKHIIIKISDTGAGIPEGIKDKIFDPFFTTKEAGKGTGQGLAIAFDVIVNRHKGRIDVESTEGKGTAFTIFLPVNIADN